MSDLADMFRVEKLGEKDFIRVEREKREQTVQKGSLFVL